MFKEWKFTESNIIDEQKRAFNGLKLIENPLWIRIEVGLEIASHVRKVPNNIWNILLPIPFSSASRIFPIKLISVLFVLTECAG